MNHAASLPSPPFDYVRDDARRRVRVTVHRTLRRHDLISIIDRQVSEGTWTYGMLYDFGLSLGPTTQADTDTLAAHVYCYLISHGPRGRVAVVARAPEMIGVVQLYAAYTARADVEVGVFWDVHEAEQWLDASTGSSPMNGPRRK